MHCPLPLCPGSYVSPGLPGAGHGVGPGGYLALLRAAEPEPGLNQKLVLFSRLLSVLLASVSFREVLCPLCNNSSFFIVLPGVMGELEGGQGACVLHTA